MDQFETVLLPHLEQYSIYLVLFRNVSNAEFLREQLITGNTAFQYTFLDASMIYSRQHLFTACFKSINDIECNRLKTHNVHSEIVFALSPNNNIAESFRRFGITSTCKDIIALKVATSPDTSLEIVRQHLLDNVQAEEVITLTDDRLVELRDLSRLRKLYKSESPNTTLEGDRLEAHIISSIILKGT